MLFRGLVRPLGARLAGADEKLDSATQANLVAQQIKAVVDVTPAVVGGAFVTSCVLIWAAVGTGAFPGILVWAAMLYAILARSLWIWANARRAGGPSNLGPGARRRVILDTAVAGAVWGLAPILLLSQGSMTLTIVTAVAIAGVLSAGGLALIVMPAAAFAFSMPVLAGSLVALTQIGDPSLAAVLTLLLASFVTVTLLVSLRQMRDFVTRRVSELKIREQNDIISLLLKEFEENSSDWLWEFDREGRIDRVSDRFQAVANRPREALVGTDFIGFLACLADGNEAVLAGIRSSIAARETFSDIELQFDDGGTETWWRLTGKPARDEFGEYAGYIGTASDITAEKQAERRISFLAHNDALTGLLNRARFTEHLRHNVARLERYGSPFAVLYMDLDQFKAVNDSLGHMVGDKLLALVAERIRKVVRETDIAARLGGDEFALILSKEIGSDVLGQLAARLIEDISKPYEIDGDFVSIGASIGIAIAPINGTRPDQILRNADLALYRSKAEGRGAYRFFESQMDSDVRERRMLELELRQALKEGELVLHYQPLVSAEDNQPSGFEALVRWNHPIRGLVPPSEFIPLAEQSGLIKQIGDWTIEAACAAATAWPDDLIVAVNLSAKHFQLSDIVAVVAAALDKTGLPPHRLELEITESLLIEQPEDVIEKLRRIKALGVTVAMDDFGTGYSSLSYLLKFPFDKIKIDKSFVTASSEDAVARDILRSIASLGKTLKIHITAEGVETQEQVDFLREIACNQLQGFYFARPLDEMDLAGYVLANFRDGTSKRTASREIEAARAG
ncbi:EAL domain-containing protein [Nitratireductor mangrovi]|uniref:EAL domain-containing protein n=1 Tax=Nitratireductor mangrovi TaxID=2599600 RepID=A0A5B8L3K6_9HYPH|nr:EAL domain-containing protein [Nitratireductor mangrovi]QDZ02240.1 EAL domain-containing protein [Nitratireductor mangrovi]